MSHDESQPLPGPLEGPSDADLLELALRPDDPRAADLVQGDPAAAARLAELSGFVRHLRAVVAADEASEPARDPGLSAELVGRVLARTTREDLSRLGDLALASRFLVARLRASGALRLAAASLLMHLLALPVVGWVVLRAPKPPARIHFAAPALPGPAFLEQEPEPEPSLAPEPVSAEAELLELDRAAGLLPADPKRYVENSLRWARHGVRGGVDLELPPATADGDLAGQLVRARVELLSGRPGAEGTLAEAAADDDPLLNALRGELLLDHLLLEGAAPPGLAAALARLDPTAAHPSSRAELLLQAHALVRAEAYGVLPLAQAPRLRAARVEHGARAPWLGAGGEAWLVAPLDALWRRLLLDAAGDRLDPALRAALRAEPAAEAAGERGG